MTQGPRLPLPLRHRRSQRPCDGQTLAPARNQEQGQRSAHPCRIPGWEVPSPPALPLSPSGSGNWPGLWPSQASVSLSSPAGWGRWLRPGPPPSPSSGGVRDLKQSPRFPGIAAQGRGTGGGVVSVRAAALLHPLRGPWVPVWSLRPHTVPTALQPSTNFLLKARLVPSAPPGHCHPPRSCQRPARS